MVAKKREEFRDDETERETALVDTLRPRISFFMETVMMTKRTGFPESESNCSEQWYELDGQEQEAQISLRDARKKLQHATKKILPKRWRPCKEHGKIHQCGATGHWEEDCTARSCKGQRKKLSVQERKI